MSDISSLLALSYGGYEIQRAITDGRGRFVAFSPAEWKEAAETLSRYRMPSIAAPRKTDRESRTTFVRSLREGERRTFPQILLMIQIICHISPQQLRNRPNVNDSPYEEVVNPARMATFTAACRCLSWLLKRNQEMVNAISLELSR